MPTKLLATEDKEASYSYHSHFKIDFYSSLTIIIHEDNTQLSVSSFFFCFDKYKANLSLHIF